MLEIVIAHIYLERGKMTNEIHSNLQWFTLEQPASSNRSLNFSSNNKKAIQTSPINVHHVEEIQFMTVAIVGFK